MPRVDAFKLWYWRRFLRFPSTARISNLSILKETTLNIHWKDWCCSSNTLATWCEVDSLEKTVILGKIEGKKGPIENEMVSSITNSTDKSFSKLREEVKDREAWHSAVHRVAKSWTQQQKWDLYRKLSKASESLTPGKQRAVPEKKCN